MSLSDISKKTKTPEIFSYYLIGFILSIVNYIILIIFVFVGGANVLFSILTGSLAGFRALGAGAVAILLAYYGLMVASYYYTKKSFDSASVALNNSHFKTDGASPFPWYNSFNYCYWCFSFACGCNFCKSWLSLAYLMN